MEYGLSLSSGLNFHLFMRLVILVSSSLSFRVEFLTEALDTVPLGSIVIRIVMEPLSVGFVLNLLLYKYLSPPM